MRTLGAEIAIERPYGRSAQPLEDIVVLDFTRFLPGPLSTQMLADLGADVIKIEGFPNGDYARQMEPFTGYVSLNRNKRSLHVDFRRPEGLKVLHRLILTADVLVEVSRPGFMASCGLDYETVSTLRPEIVYCSVSAYGQAGPYATLPSHGCNIEALAGVLDICEDTDGTPRLGPGGRIMGTNLLTGHAAATGICAALVRRAKTGRGAFIDAGCWDCGIAGDPVNSASELSGVPWTEGFGSRQTPKYAPYRTADQRYLMVCVIERKFWEGFCAVIGRADLIDRFGGDHLDDMGDRDAAVYDEIAHEIASRPLAEWEARFADAALPVTPVYTREEALRSANARARNMVIAAHSAIGGDYEMVGSGLVIDGVRGVYRRPAPALGEHDAEILAGLGYASADMAALRDAGVIR